MKNFFLYAIFLSAFSGTLLAIDIGFTLKLSQIFALILFPFSIIDFIDKFYKNSHKHYVPFIIFILSILPSFTSENIFSDIYEVSNRYRFFFNYLFLQIIFFVITIYINDKKKLKNSLIYILMSYILVLLFGFYQQIGFYLGFYNPLDYLGKHSLFVDFYGPFLRISPATFANEFGEITQTILIFFTTYLFYYKKLKNSISKKIDFKLILDYSFLGILLLTLFLNFTRASWIVYILFLIIGFTFSKIKTNFRLLLISMLFILIIGIYIIDLETNFLSYLLILDRFLELSDLSQSSASMRLLTWEESYNLFSKNIYTILFGNGWGSTIDTHNVPLELLSETGIIGFFGYLNLIFYLIKTFYENIKNSYQDIFYQFVSISIFYSFLGCLIFDFTNHGLYHFIFWFIIALGISLNNILYKSNNKKSA